MKHVYDQIVSILGKYYFFPHDMRFTEVVRIHGKRNGHMVFQNFFIFGKPGTYITEVPFFRIYHTEDFSFVRLVFSYMRSSYRITVDKGEKTPKVKKFIKRMVANNKTTINSLVDKIVVPLIIES